MHFTLISEIKRNYHFWILKKNALSMHVLKERYVKKCGKDICGSEFYTLVVSFCSKHNIFSKIITR
jgi:hypothetical protein